MINDSYSNIYKAFAGKKIEYVDLFYSDVFMGYLIRLFQVGSPVNFIKAWSEVRKVSKSHIFKKCMKYYCRPSNGSRLFPFFLKLGMFFFASLLAKIRMLKTFYRNEPIRQWCFNKK